MTSKHKVAEAADVGAAATRNAALGFRVFHGAAAMTPYLARLALPFTIAAAGAGAAFHGARAHKQGKSAGDIAKDAAWGALDSLTVGQIQEGSMTRRALHSVRGALTNGPQNLSPADKAKFAEMNTHYEASHMAAAPSEPDEPTGGPRGWANPKVQAAAQAARGIAPKSSTE